MEALWHHLKILLVLASTILAAWPAAAQFDKAPPDPGSLFGQGPAASNGEKGVVSVQGRFTAPAEGRPGRLSITATIEPGWHIYSITQPPGGPLATKIEVKPPQGVRIVGEFQASPPPDSNKEPAFDNLTVETHHGTVTWSAPSSWLPASIPRNSRSRAECRSRRAPMRVCRRRGSRLWPR